MFNRSIPFIVGAIFMLAMLWQGSYLHSTFNKEVNADKTSTSIDSRDSAWVGASPYQIPTGTPYGNLVWYGHALIENTSHYFGPQGTVAQTTNGMNCQNCHLAAGALPFGNNFGKVYAAYPQFRARNNGIQTIYGRIKDCFERSLNGLAPDSTTIEVRAMYAYITWLGDGVPKGRSPVGASLPKLPYLKRAASAVEGQKVYMATCSVCHGNNGQGQRNVIGAGYAYPPLWGANSYNDGAGMYRISTFAAYVKNNMPFGVTYKAPQLTNEQAWDVAAFVNSQPRPHKDQAMDWKNIALKPIDFPFGPYADSLSETRHKYGPYR